ncbi:GNAT family N-acetyltransferase [Bombella favorum]|uniref:GNAT family N-acetyltransferase n=1 Tax=Bombella favorum TaxID=2039164 RepID=A0ABR5ZL20_9PROT|nr:GNAT family N-acetyltransferase [Bombella favorum]MBA5725021.1 GNAT family N-acetyltransferase [Bombella favorum]
MSQQSYLIDTNILIELEDDHTVEEVYLAFLALANKYKVNIYVHETARDDLLQDRDEKRRDVSLSKIGKYNILKGQRGVDIEKLKNLFGSMKKRNDVVDMKILHSLDQGSVDFLVTQDKGIHQRAQRFSSDLARRVLFINDAKDLLIQTYEPRHVRFCHVEKVEAQEIDISNTFFDSLREGYPKFNTWWKEKCIREHRSCWVVYDDYDGLAGLIVWKDENKSNTDAVTKLEKILKICTFKVSSKSRGIKLGELLLKQVFWYAQRNRYNLVYLTTYEDQTSLISLLEYYGFVHLGNKGKECIFERKFSSKPLCRLKDTNSFDQACQSYPRFLFDDETRSFGIPIKEDYHDILYPDLYDPRQKSMFDSKSKKPGNTIRKVYLCRAQSKLGPPGSLLFFYKGKSKNEPSQCITVLGVLDSVKTAKSIADLMRFTGGRSVYSEDELRKKWNESPTRPMKVINYLLVSYIEPEISIHELVSFGIIKKHPQQSIYEIPHEKVKKLIKRAKLDFDPMTQNIIAVTGISGVGKTTFLEKLSERIIFQHLTGGNLIATARKTSPDSRDQMRYMDIDENQRFLIEGFHALRDQDSRLIIVDGHVIIDNGNGLSKINSEVFKEIDVNIMIHLEADPNRIFNNRLKDESRNRPIFSVDILKEHQDISRAQAEKISSDLGIKLYVIDCDDIDGAFKVIQDSYLE